MRSILLTVSAAFLVLAGTLPVSADGPGEKPESRRVTDPPPKLIERFDKNGDGKLDAEERIAVRAAAEKRRAEGSPAGKPGSGEPKADFLRFFDRDGNGKLDEQELKAAGDAREKLRQESAEAVAAGKVPGPRDGQAKPGGKGRGDGARRPKMREGMKRRGGEAGPGKNARFGRPAEGGKRPEGARPPGAKGERVK